MATAMKVPTIFTAVDRFSHVVDRMSKSASAFGTTAQASAMRTSRSFNSAGSSMLRSGTVMGVGIGIAVNEAVKFEDQMGKINTILHKSPEGLKMLSKDIRTFSKSSVNNIEDLTKSYLDLASAGVAEKNIMPMIKTGEKLSLGGIGTMEDATGVLLAKMRAFPLEKLTMEQMGNQAQKIMTHGVGTLSELAPVYAKGASQFAISGGGSAEYDAMIAGLTAGKQTMAESVVEIMQMISSAQKGTKSISKIYEQLNVGSFAELVKKNGGQVLKSLTEITDKGTKMGLNINKIWQNRNAAIGISLLTKNVSVLDQYTKAYNDTLNHTNDELTKAYKERSDNTAAKFQRLKNNLVDLAITIGDAVLPALNLLVNKVTPIVQGIADWAKENKWLAKSILYIAATLLTLGVFFKGVAIVFRVWSAIFATYTGVMTAYTFISTLAALANVSFATALWGVVVALWAAVWPVLAVVAALAVMAVWIYDVVNHWEDWKEILLVIVGPIGWITMGLLKIIEHSNKIRNAFAFEGWFGGLKAIGRMLVDMILTPLEKIFNVMSRLPMVGDHFKFMSASIADYRSGFSAIKSVGNLSGASQFQNLGGVMPNWGSAENLAGKNQNQASMEKGGTLRVVIDDKTNKVKDVDDTNVYGIPVVLSGNQGNWGR